MTLPASVALIASAIQTEFGGANPASLSEYYKGGTYVSGSANAPNVPTSGTIAFDDFYGASSTSSQPASDDVFDISIYDGNGAARSIVTGKNMSTTAGMVWIKRRNTTENHCLFDTLRGTTAVLNTNATAASSALASSVTAFNSNGFSLGTATGVNTSAGLYAAWTFMENANFFKMATVTHTTGTASTVNLSSLGTVGMVSMKRTDSTSDWWVWHRSGTAGNNLRLNTTAAQSTTQAYLSVSGTTLTIASAQASGTYIIYAWAHNAAASGIIQCGSYTGNGSTAGPFAPVTWESQFILIKRRDSTGNWVMFDNLRGTTVSTVNATLLGNATTAESLATQHIISVADGFVLSSTSADTNASGGVYLYMAVRRSNKVPTSGTQVFWPSVYTGTNTNNRALNVGIQADMVWLRRRSASGAGYEGFLTAHRLRGQTWIKTEGSGPNETTTANGLDQQLATSEWGTAFTSNNAIYIGNASGATNTSPNINADTTANNHVCLAFKRARGAFDTRFYWGSGVAGPVGHQLGVVPEMMIVRSLLLTNNWLVWHKDLTSINHQLYLDTSSPEFGPYNEFTTMPTSTVFNVGTAAIVNSTSSYYLWHGFATVAGVTKVGSYTGNGTNQNISCGFAGTARFLLVKNRSSGHWYVFDSARGITAGNDPYLTTSSTAAEGTGANSVAAFTGGFNIIQNGSTNLNLSSNVYIYLAIA